MADTCCLCIYISFCIWHYVYLCFSANICCERKALNVCGCVSVQLLLFHIYALFAAFMSQVARNEKDNDKEDKHYMGNFFCVCVCDLTHTGRRNKRYMQFFEVVTVARHIYIYILFAGNISVDVGKHFYNPY